MKKFVLALGFAALALPSLSHAYQVPAFISHIYCAGPGVTVTFTGFQTFNVTQFNIFGFPFSEQAVITNADTDGSSKLEFEMQGVITKGDYTLTLSANGLAGSISGPNGTVPLACNSGGKVGF